MDARAEWIRSTLVPVIVAKNWPRATIVDVQLGGRLGGNPIDGGFASNTYRLVLRVQHADEEQTQNLLVKVSPNEPDLRVVFNSDLQFLNEAWMYEHVVPALQSLHSNASELWPRCLLCRRDSSELAALVMDDLSQQGFRLAQPATELDAAHARLALERLAVMHALTYVLKARQPDEYRRLVHQFKETTYDPKNADEYRNLLRMSVQRGIAPLRQREDCRELVAALDRALVDPFSRLTGLLQPRDSATDVLCHGDFLRNNVLFKYDEEGKPYDIRLIDFATVRESSPATDVVLFLYMSVSEEARQDEGLSTLLASYHDALTNTLHELGDDVPDPWHGELKKLQSAVLRHSLFAYCVCSTFLPVMVADGKDVSMDEFASMTEEERTQFNLQLGGPEATRRLVNILLDFKERGVHKLWGELD